MPNSRKASGFTLIEVLLALALASLVLLAGTSLLVNLSQIWVKRPAARQAFDAHVNGVARFLTATLAKAVPSPLSPNDPAIRLEIPVGDLLDEDRITFSLKDAPPMLHWPREATAGITCHLHLKEGEGLSILWFSNLQEMKNSPEGKKVLKEEDELMKTLLSPVATKITYCYYVEQDDPPEKKDKEWEELDELREDSDPTVDKRLLPEFIKLEFEHQDAKKTLMKTVSIPIKKPPPNGLYPESN